MITKDKLMMVSFVLLLNFVTLASATPTYSLNSINTVTSVEGNYTTLSVFWNSIEPLSTAILSTNETVVWTEYIKPIEYTEELVPILYYHRIIETPDGEYTTTLENFVAHMDFLYKNNYNTITFAELVEHMSTSTKLPEKSVVLTFDDGWKEFSTVVLPILKSRGFVATFFIITNATIYSDSDYPGYMNIADVQTLYNAGMEIAGHAKTHPLGGLLNSSVDLNIEINQSTQDICGWIGECPKSFAYPEGVYNQTIIDWVQQNGYIGARAIEKDGVEEGWTEPRFAWLRAAGNETNKFTIGSNIINNETSGGSGISFERLVNYTKRNEFEDMYSVDIDAGLNGGIVIEDQFEMDSYSSIALPDTGDKVSVGVLIPSDDDYNITFRVLTGGWDNNPNSYQAESNAYSYYIDGAMISHTIMKGYVNDTYTISGENSTFWGYTWGTHQIWNRHISAGFHNITVVASTDWNMLDYFTIDYSNKVINASNYYNSPRFPRTYEAWTNFTWRNDSVPMGNVVGWKVYANDTTGSGNTTDIFSFNFIPVNKSFSWSNNQTQLVNNYTPAGYSNFSITWGDNSSSLSGAYLENNFTGSSVNTTMNGTYPNYYYNTTPLATGTYMYRFVANDLQGNENATDIQYFTIGMASNPVNIYLNGTLNSNNSNYTYPEAVNATATSLIGDVYLYRNGTLVANGTMPSEEVLLGNGTYEYKVNATGNQNYSDNTSGSTYYAMVNKGTLDLSIDFSPSNTIIVGNQITITGIRNNIGDDDVNYSLWQGNNLLANEEPYQKVEPSLGLGTYNYIFNASGGENWTANIAGVSGILTVQVPGTTTIYGGSGGGGGYTPTYTNDDEDNTTTESTSTTGDSGSETVTSEDDCAEDWICSSWSDCINGTQIRTCYDTNDCGTVFNIDEETQECEEQPSIITGMFTFLTTPTGIGLMGFMALVVIFLISRTNGKLKLNFLKKLIKK
ncbi:MAG: polysaccharide deacetylase family protein [Candidatus Aenigmatarchaeota archaeon]